MTAFPIEITEQILLLSLFLHPSGEHPAHLLSLNRSLRSFLLPCHYNHVSIVSKHSLENFVRTLKESELIRNLVKSFFLRGPQGKKSSKRILAFFQDDPQSEPDEQDPFSFHGRASDSRESEDESEDSIEQGFEGFGQEATIDVHEALIAGVTEVLHLCSASLKAFGFIECVPWFAAPAWKLEVNLLQAEEYTGTTFGIFGLLPHVNSNQSRGREEGEFRIRTSFKRIHLLGGDFGSFVCMQSLPTSPTSETLTDFHITAPTLYRREHQERLVTYISTFLRSMPALKRLSVGFTRYSNAPLRSKVKSRGVDEGDDLPFTLPAGAAAAETATAAAKGSPSSKPRVRQCSGASVGMSSFGSIESEGVGDDSFEQSQMSSSRDKRADRVRMASPSSSSKPHSSSQSTSVHASGSSQRTRAAGPNARSPLGSTSISIEEACPPEYPSYMAYLEALPLALQRSERTGVVVRMLEIPCINQSPTGFAGWIMSPRQSIRRWNREPQTRMTGQEQGQLYDKPFPKNLDLEFVNQLCEERDLNFYLPHPPLQDGVGVGSKMEAGVSEEALLQPHPPPPPPPPPPTTSSKTKHTLRWKKKVDPNRLTPHGVGVDGTPRRSVWDLDPSWEWELEEAGGRKNLKTLRSVPNDWEPLDRREVALQAERELDSVRLFVERRRKVTMD
ncbi:hypothetical protein IE53DRAFT_64272 [Violaceomyces palustris]|uniref:Uncharacterized protein n=1 Tax=Violaceomyces palustris TaxID=1673888 RepID=A0ACD0NZ94_9BASI|nr:hypothetical protein IE53DRAFT_64272 [Violaceomyces palustris]